jgi:hypothetical protein
VFPGIRCKLDAGSKNQPSLLFDARNLGKIPAFQTIFSKRLPKARSVRTFCGILNFFDVGTTSRITLVFDKTCGEKFAGPTLFLMGSGFSPNGNTGPAGKPYTELCWNSGRIGVWEDLRACRNFSRHSAL